MKYFPDVITFGRNFKPGPDVCETPTDCAVWVMGFVHAAALTFAGHGRTNHIVRNQGIISGGPPGSKPRRFEVVSAKIWAVPTYTAKVSGVVGDIYAVKTLPRLRHSRASCVSNF